MVRKAIAQRLINGVWLRVYVHINVNIRKAKVALPIPLESMLLIDMPGTKARAARHSMLGQSIEMVIHIIRTPIKMPTTCMAAPERPAGAGRYWKNRIKIMEIAIIHALFAEDTFIFVSLHTACFAAVTIKNNQCDLIQFAQPKGCANIFKEL